MSFALTILGSNSALPTSDGFPSAHVLQIHEHFFLIDCGEGTQIQLRRNKINFNKIDSIFISHLHGDHYFGIFGLLSTFSLMGRTKELHIYADSEIRTKIHTIVEPETINFKINFHPLNFKKTDTIFENNSIIIKSFPLQHRINTCGFYFAEKAKKANIIKEYVSKFNLSIKEIVKIKNGEDYINPEGEIISNSILTRNPSPPRSYAYCSDTAYLTEIVEIVKNVDILYHEATFQNEDKELAVKTGHSTASDAANIAKAADAKKLILGHFSTRYKNTDKILSQAKSIFENTFIAKENNNIQL